MAVNYPVLCTTNAAKGAFIERAMRLLQIEHNIMGAWFKPSAPVISLSIYQKLRAAVQLRWPYTGEKLSKTEWVKYKNERFDVKQEVLVLERGRLKELLYASTRFSPNLDDDVT